MVSYRTDRFGRPGSNRDQLLARREHRISATDGLEEQRGHETEKGNKVSGRNCSWSWRRESWNVGINWKLPYIHCEFHGGKAMAELVLTFVENWWVWTREGSRD